MGRYVDSDMSMYWTFFFQQSVAYDRSSAPKSCRISGWLQGQDTSLPDDTEKMFLLAEFTYDLEKSNAQTFHVLDSAGSGVVDTIRFDFSSNHGSPSHTCIYRLRVHGHEPDSVSMMPMQSWCHTMYFLLVIVSINLSCNHFSWGKKKKERKKLFHVFFFITFIFFVLPIYSSNIQTQIFLHSGYWLVEGFVCRVLQFHAIKCTRSPWNT